MTTIGPYTVSVDDGLVHVTGLDEVTTVAALSPADARITAGIVGRWAKASGDPETEYRLTVALYDAARAAEQVTA